ncbi:hypothetical protein [Kitasatospora cheerisanensis]|uniref:Uncharacterized protein n=1 Tax=Kitasatospora cheerisanensis KCTC 2395 TaxID=1348663 RepID=A0A066YKN3_9ACTN|nr:hypothetical protein [Kitasatospora cheerisanensis]KDN80499.1 hypothetical protein KCH_77330 [Kitasatospora cheerisanensis KCTC 2395]
MTDHHLDSDRAVAHELRAHALDVAQLADDTRRYQDDLRHDRAHPEAADRLAALGERIARQAHRITGLRDATRTRQPRPEDAP